MTEAGGVDDQSARPPPEVGNLPGSFRGMIGGLVEGEEAMSSEERGGVKITGMMAERRNGR